MLSNQSYYRNHIGKDVPLFHQPWWLDSVCGNQWDAALLKSGEVISAYYVYAFQKNKLGFHIVMPQFTQFLGPNYKLTYPGIRERNNAETEILDRLLAQFPGFSSFESRWQHKFQNWLPLHWNHFQQRTRYTYSFKDISNPEDLKRNFSEKIIREIGRASKVFTIENADDITPLYEVLKKNFSEKKARVRLDKEFLQSLFNAAKNHDAGKVFFARDNNGKIAAGIFVAWDAVTAYYIIGGKDSAFGNSGAMSLLFWNAINHLKNKVTCFDFEGSMIKGVEQYFRSFGAEQKGFFEITKINSPVLRIKSIIKTLLGKT